MVSLLGGLIPEEIFLLKHQAVILGPSASASQVLGLWILAFLWSFFFFFKQQQRNLRYISVYVYVYVHVCACISQRSTSPPFPLFEAGSLSSLELAKLGEAGWPTAPGICLSLPLQHWENNYVPLGHWLFWFWRQGLAM